MRIFKYALKNIKRNPFLSFSSVLVISLILFFICILFLLNYTADILIKDVSSRLSMSVTLNKGYTNENSEVVELISNIRSIGVDTKVTYVSSEEALVIMKKNDPEITKLIEKDSDNPLPATIKVENIGITRYDTLNEIIKKYKGVVMYDENRFKKKIVDFKQQHDKVKIVIQVFNAIKIGIFVIVGFFIFSVFIIIYNIIGNFIFFYKDEIKVTKLVGGENIFIYGPFSIQGFIYTFVSSIISISFFLYFLKIANKYYIDDNFPKFVENFLLTYSIFFFYLIIGISFIGMLSGFLSSQKFISKSK